MERKVENVIEKDIRLDELGNVLKIVNSIKVDFNDDADWRREYFEKGAEDTKNLILTTLTSYILELATGYTERDSERDSDKEELPEIFNRI